MARFLDEVIGRLAPAEQAQVQARHAALRDELAALQALRALLRQSRAAFAERLGTNPVGVAKMERRIDAYLETLRDSIRGVGGELEVVARFPDRPSIRLRQFQGLSDPEQE